MPDEVRNSMKQSLQHGDVKSLNLPSLSERTFVQTLNHRNCFCNDRLKSSHQFRSGQPARCSELRLSIASVWCLQNPCNAPLIEIPRQMQQQIGDAVQAFVRLQPKLLVAQLPDAMSNLPHCLIQQMFKLCYDLI